MKYLLMLALCLLAVPAAAQTVDRQETIRIIEQAEALGPSQNMLEVLTKACGINPENCNAVAKAAPNSDQSIGYYEKWCSQPDGAAPCGWLLVGGATFQSAWPPIVCKNGQSRPDDMRRDFLRWVSANPSMREFNVTFGMLRFFVNTYPCPSRPGT